MNILCLDIGNTSISLCESRNLKLGKLKRVPCSDDFMKVFSNYDLDSINQVLLCSVVPNITDIIINFFDAKKIDIFEINYKSDYIKLLVDNPMEVGNDRICNVAAIKKLYKSPSIIIDFGTATTYDVTNENGDFIGGAIAPGIDISANYLIEKTALLKGTVYQFPNKIIGKNTITNIQSGVMYGGLESVKGMIKLIKKEINYINPNIIITGGFGQIISSSLHIKHDYIELLTIKGMLDIFNSSN